MTLKTIYCLSKHEYYYTLVSLPLLWMAESVLWIFKISAREVRTAYYTIIISRTLKVTGNHVMYDCRAWCCKGNHVEQKHDYFPHAMYNKTIIRFGFCDIQNNRGLGKGYQPQASADNPYLDLDYSGYHKNLIQSIDTLDWHSIDISI